MGGPSRYPQSRALTDFSTHCMLTIAMEKTLGDKLRELREERDLSLRELARQLREVTAAHLSDIEFGRRYPSDALLKKLAKYFGLAEKDLRALDLRPPVEEIKRLAQTDASFGLALRKLVNKEVTPDEILQMSKNKEHKPKEK